MTTTMGVLLPKRGFALQIALVIVAISWLVVPVVCLPFSDLPQRYWVVQDTPRLYLVIAIVGLIWFLFGLALVLIVGVSLNLKLVGGLLAGALIASGGIGSAAFNLINCIGDQSPGQPMEFEQVSATLKGSALLRAVADPIAGMTFAISVTRVPTSPVAPST